MKNISKRNPNIDSDFPHPNDDIAKLVDEIHDLELVIRQSNAELRYKKEALIRSLIAKDLTMTLTINMSVVKQLIRL
jgi:hypothetical protein